MSLSHFLGKCEAKPYLEWERKVEELFQIYNIMEIDKVPIALESFPHAAIGWWESIFEFRRRRGLKPIKT